MRHELHVGGFEPFSTCDWPGQITAVVFCQGCALRCGYCHNPHLIPTQGGSDPSWDQIMAFLARRRDLLDGVVFSGGEPLLQGALPDAMAAVHALGFKIGLHTACPFPSRLARILPLLDWVGLDLKTLPERYVEVCGSSTGQAAWEGLQLIRQAGIAHEIRTTVHPRYHDAVTLGAMAKRLDGLGEPNWIWQACRIEGALDPTLEAASSPDPTQVDSPIHITVR